MLAILIDCLKLPVFLEYNSPGYQRHNYQYHQDYVSEGGRFTYDFPERTGK
jgi:hypothetical protein